MDTFTQIFLVVLVGLSLTMLVIARIWLNKSNKTLDEARELVEKLPPFGDFFDGQMRSLNRDIVNQLILLSEQMEKYEIAAELHKMTYQEGDLLLVPDHLCVRKVPFGFEVTMMKTINDL